MMLPVSIINAKINVKMTSAFNHHAHFIHIENIIWAIRLKAYKSVCGWLTFRRSDREVLVCAASNQINAFTRQKNEIACVIDTKKTLKSKWGSRWLLVAADIAHERDS